MAEKNLLLLAGSKVHGQGLLEFAREWIDGHFPDKTKPVFFVPYAEADHDAYAAKIRDALSPLGISVVSAHEDGAVEKLENNEVSGVFIGGGNTFRLLKTIQDNGLRELIREKVEAGLPYMGSSAGTNMACPTIKTTNDMPIVMPDSFDAIGLVDFQINPHFLDPDPNSKHQGETRDERIREFHEENTTPVLGIREGTALRIKGSRIELLGEHTARLFNKDCEPVELEGGAGKDLSRSISPKPRDFGRG